MRNMDKSNQKYHIMYGITLALSAIIMFYMIIRNSFVKGKN